MSNRTVPLSPRRLTRGDGPLGGVSAGLADYFNIDVTLVRLGLVATTIIGFPTVPIAYVAAWLIIPQADQQPVGPPMGQTPPPPPPPVPPPAPPAPSPGASAPPPVEPTDTGEPDTGEADTGEPDTETGEP